MPPPRRGSMSGRRRDSMPRMDGAEGLQSEIEKRESQGRLKQLQKLSKVDDILSHVSFVEAIPQLLKLLKLLWILVPLRTIIMLLGNFTKSLLPAVDLRIRAQLIEIINTTIRRDRAFEGRRIGRLLVLQLFSLVFRNWLETSLNSNQQFVNSKLTAVLRRQLMNAHLKLDTAALEQPETQRLLTDAVSMASPGYLNSLIHITFNLTNSITDITARVAATSRTISIDALPYFLLYSFVPLVHIMYSRFRQSLQSTPADQSDRLRKEDLASIAFDSKSRREVSLLGLQDYIVDEYSAVDERLQDAETKRIQNSTIISRAMNIMSAYSNSIIYSFLAWRSQTSDISLADLHLIENTTTSLINTADRAIKTQEHSSSVLSLLINYYKALELKRALPMAESPIMYQAGEKGGMKIEFRHVSFRYAPDSPLVLDDVSFIIESGEVAALVGYNGSGKSTLIALLARVYDPTSGQILLNDCDLKEYDLDSVARHMAFTHQDFARWPLTGFENVAVGNIKQSDVDSVEEAARATGAYEVLNAQHRRTKSDTKQEGDSAADPGEGKLWHQRLSKMTSEMLAAQTDSANGAGGNMMRKGMRLMQRGRGSGIELSGGQWAKVALSRSFLRKGDLLVLDEPSANLDPQAEHDLFSNLLKIRLGRTILFITHRLGVVRASDKILFLEKGRLVEQGTHEDLMGREAGMYRHLVTLQTSGFQKS